VNLLDDGMSLKDKTRVKPTPTRWAGLLIACLVLLAFAGCGGSGSGPAAGFAAGGGGNVSVPPEVTATKELLDASVLASLPRPNPFLSLLEPVTSEEDETTEGGKPEETPSPTPPPPDPFEAYSLDGIIYRQKGSMAIISIDGGKSKIVRSGEVLNTPTDPPYQVKISKIDKQSLTMTVVDSSLLLPPEMQSKTLRIVSMVGYKGGSSGKSARSGKATSTTSSQTVNSNPIDDIAKLLNPDSKGLGNIPNPNLPSSNGNIDEILKGLPDETRQKLLQQLNTNAEDGGNPGPIDSKSLSEIQDLLKKEMEEPQ
jgi:hypothetical protein